MLSCARRPCFETYMAVTPQEVLSELIYRCESVEGFTAEPEFQLSGPFGRFRFKGDIDYGVDRGWHVLLSGPLGIRLAEIESIGNRFIINMPYNTMMTEVDIDHPVNLPEYDISFPDLSFATTLLMPYTSLTETEEWSIACGEAGSPGNISLVRTDGTVRDSLVLSLDYSPLRVWREKLWRNDGLQSSRRFIYNDKNDYLPFRIIIEINDLMLDVKYRSLKMDISSPRETKTTEAL